MSDSETDTVASSPLSSGRTLEDNPQSSSPKSIPSKNRYTFNVRGLPVRPLKADCEFFLKTGHCAFGKKCKYNHPLEKMEELQAKGMNSGGLPIRPAASPCDYFMRTGACNFGPLCKFNHPQCVIDKRVSPRLQQLDPIQSSIPMSLVLVPMAPVHPIPSYVTMSYDYQRPFVEAWYS